MEQKQLLRIYGFLALLFIIFTVTPWYITINRPSVNTESIKLQEVKNLDDKTKIHIDNASSKHYYEYKNYTVTKTKSLIPYVYKDSTVTNVGSVYSN